MKSKCIIFTLLICLLISISSCNTAETAQPVTDNSIKNISKPIHIVQTVEVINDVCKNEGVRECYNYNSFQICGYYDNIPGLEWSPVISCPSNTFCSQGVCVVTPVSVAVSCADECSPEGIRQCKDSGYQVCGNYDSGECLEWSSTTVCSVNTVCENGVCVENKIIVPPAVIIPPSVVVPPVSSSPGVPFIGSSDARLKVLFVDIGNAPYADELRDSIVNNEFKAISPFKEHFNDIAFYSVNIDASPLLKCEGIDASLTSSGFFCNSQAMYDAINKKVSIPDLGKLIVIAFGETEYGGSGGDIIYIGTSRNRDLNTQLALVKNVAIHEVGHNFGLADLYYGTFYYDGSPSQFWPTDFSRAFLNVDGPGCPKWCSSYKPVSEYIQSGSSQCLTFTDKQSCVSFARDSQRSCISSKEFEDCCVWSDTPFEYFGTNCVPALGSENIGIGCLEGSGCYYGAVYGNYAWRPVLRGTDSIMWHPTAGVFDSVSMRELNKIFECCLSDSESSSSCTDFRRTYSDFLINTNFKKTIGSCGKQ